METPYVPFLAFCVKSYCDKLKDFFNIKITDYIRTDFLTLFANNNVPNETEILTKYGENIQDFFIKKNKELQNYFNCEEGNSIALGVNINVARVSNKNNADFTFYESRNPSDTKIIYMNKMIEVNKSHTLTHHEVASRINEAIINQNIAFSPIRKNDNGHLFTTSCLDILLKRLNLKSDEKYVAKIENGKTVIYKYSEILITFLLSQIREDKDIVIKLCKLFKNFSYKFPCSSC